MGLDELRSKIEKETEAEALRIEDEGRAEAKRILDAAREEAAKQRAAFREETSEVLESIEKKSLSDAEFENRRKVMTRRKQALDDIFASARQKRGSLVRRR